MTEQKPVMRVIPHAKGQGGHQDSTEERSSSQNSKIPIWKRFGIFFSHFFKIIGSITRLTKRKWFKQINQGQNLTENPQKGSLLRFYFSCSISHMFYYVVIRYNVVLNLDKIAKVRIKFWGGRGSLKLRWSAQICSLVF